MPYLRIFSVGEVLRSGVGPAARMTKLTVVGYALVALFEGWILAPVYGIRLIVNWRKIRAATRAIEGDSNVR